MRKQREKEKRVYTVINIHPVMTDEERKKLMEEDLKFFWRVITDAYKQGRMTAVN